MTAVALRAAESLADAYQGPVVTIDYRQPCATQRLELSRGHEGPELLDVIKALCRDLDAPPHHLAFEPDPARRRRYGWEAGAYVLIDGRRVARAGGISALWLTSGAGCLSRRGWRPGRNREWGQGANPGGGPS